MKKIILFAFAAALVTVLSGCGTTNIDCNYKDMGAPEGRPIAHVNTSTLGYHLIGIYPIFGLDGSLTTAFNEFNKEAKRLNGTKVEVVESTTEHLWMRLPPFTWIITPTLSEVAGTVY